MRTPSELPVAAAVQRLGGIQPLIFALSKYPGFKKLSASTVSRWSKLHDSELPSRALQALDILRRHLSPNQSIKTAIANGLWSLVPMLLETPKYTTEDGFPLLQNTRAALGNLIISVEVMLNGQDVIDSIARRKIHIGVVSERYLDVIHKAYAAEIVAIAQISRGIPLGLTTQSFVENYVHANGAGNLSETIGRNILSDKKTAVLAKTMGSIILSDFNTSRVSRKQPDMVPAYSFREIAELLATGQVEFALGWEPEITSVRAMANNYARNIGESDKAVIKKFERLPDFAFSESEIKFYLICGTHLPFDLLLRYLKALQTECGHISTYLQNRSADSGSLPSAYNGDQMALSIAACVEKHMSGISDHNVRLESLWRALRTTHFEVTDLKLDGIIKIYECGEARHGV